MKHFPAAIIGGGPAGAACASQLVEAGLDCVILDKAEFPRPKVCAGWIAPDVFNNLGILPSQYPHDLSEFSSLSISLGRFPITLRGTQYAIRRVEFDKWLLDLSGAKFIQHEVKNIQRISGVYRIDDLFSADYVIGAGGTHCPVYQGFFKDKYPRQGAQIAALEDEYPYDWTDPTCRLWFFKDRLPGYAWYVPKKGGYINIGLGGNAHAVIERGSSIKEHWDRFLYFLQNTGLIKNREFHPKGYTYYLRGSNDRPRIDNMFLIGDSAGLSTLDMGEGIGPAVQSGLVAARSILDGNEYSLVEIPRFSFLPKALQWIVKK
jgi:flavin-dependent dehydrogenase